MKKLVILVATLVALVVIWVALSILQIISYNADPIGYPQMSDVLVLVSMAGLLIAVPILVSKGYCAYQQDKTDFLKQQVEVAALRDALMSWPQLSEDYSLAA